MPLFSARIDFYIRVFVRVYTSAREITKTPLKLSNVYQCVGCDAFYLQPLGHHNGRTCAAGRGPPVGEQLRGMRLAACNCGPHVEWPCLQQGIRDRGRTPGIPARCAEKHVPARHNRPADLWRNDKIAGGGARCTLFYNLSSLSKRLHVRAPGAAAIMAGIASTGYNVSSAASNPDSIKTNAPASVVWDVMRAWAKENPPSKKRDDGQDTAGKRILSKASKTAVDFKTHQFMIKGLRKTATSMSKTICRHQMNPTKNWGPKSRATGKKRKKM